MKKIYLTIVIMLATLSLAGQNLRTGYFLDGYSYRYQFNPAFQGNTGFISVPVFSGISAGLETSLGFKDLLYPTSSGTLGTFLHPDVSDDAVMKNLGGRTLASQNLDMNILALGFRTKKSYHTFDISLKENIDLTLPGDIFRFFKVGGSDNNAVYNLSDLSFSTDAYAQVAYGYSRRFLDKFNVGLRVKGLVGIESARTDIRNLTLKMESDQWMVNANGSATMSSIVSGLLTESETPIEEILLSEIKTPNLGMAIDLGVSVDVLKYITLSASILDLGFISWNNVGIYNLANDPWVYEGFELSADQTGENTVEEQFQAKMDELGALFNFSEITPVTKARHRQMLAMTVHVGAEARMPFYERLSVGLLGTHRFKGSHLWTEGRFSLNLALLRWFSLGANYAISNYGHSYGAAVNIHPRGFSLFLGTDSFRPFTSFAPGSTIKPFKVTPLNELNTNLVFGINFPFGKYNGRFPKAEKKSVEQVKD